MPQDKIIIRIVFPVPKSFDNFIPDDQILSIINVTPKEILNLTVL